MKKTSLILLFATLTSFALQASNSAYFNLPAPGNEAVVFAPGIICFNNRNEQGGSFSPDGSKFIFETSSDTIFHYTKIHQFEKNENKWTETSIDLFPEPGIDFFGSSFSPDNSCILLCSTESIWKSMNKDDQWLPPVQINNISPPSAINMGLINIKTLSASLAQDNTLFYVKYNPLSAPGFFDIYMAENKNNSYPISQRSDILNSQEAEYSVFIAPDKSYILLSSAHENIAGEGSDIFVCFKKRDGSWTYPRNLRSNINSAENEVLPWVSPCGKYLFFTRITGSFIDMQSDIFWVDAKIIDDLRDINSKPVLKTPITDVEGMVGKQLEFTIADNTFYDDDPNDSLSYSACLINGSTLPGWLAFNPTNLTFSGTPQKATNLSVLVTATDKENEKVSDIFNISIIHSTSIAKENHSLVKIFPNPTYNNICINISENHENIEEIIITNLSGKIVFQSTGPTENLQNIKLASLKSDVYILSIKTKNSFESHRIIKK